MPTRKTRHLMVKSAALLMMLLLLMMMMMVNGNQLWWTKRQTFCWKKILQHRVDVSVDRSPPGTLVMRSECRWSLWAYKQQHFLLSYKLLIFWFLCPFFPLSASNVPMSSTGPRQLENIFVTVGSTQFDHLIDALVDRQTLQVCLPFLLTVHVKQHFNVLHRFSRIWAVKS